MAWKVSKFSFWVNYSFKHTQNNTSFMWGLSHVFPHTWQTYEWPQASLSLPSQPLVLFFSARALNELALTPWAFHCFHSRLPIRQCVLRDPLSVSPNHQSQLSCYISVNLSSYSLFSLLSRWWHLQLRCGDLCRPELYCSFQWGASLLSLSLSRFLSSSLIWSTEYYFYFK